MPKPHQSYTQHCFPKQNGTHDTLGTPEASDKAGRGASNAPLVGVPLSLERILHPTGIATAHEHHTSTATHTYTWHRGRWEGREQEMRLTSKFRPLLLMSSRLVGTSTTSTAAYGSVARSLRMFTSACVVQQRAMPAAHELGIARCATTPPALHAMRPAACQQASR